MALAPATHPMGVFEMLRNSFRQYSIAGTGYNCSVAGISNQAGSAPIPVSGTITMAPGGQLPAQMTFNLMRGGAVVKTGGPVAVNQTTGAYSGSIAPTSPAGTLYTVAVLSTGDGKISGTSAAFTLT